MSDDSGLKRLPLHDLHASSGARFGAFAGWWMPLTYPLGVMKEHLHTRTAAGLFDISHMRVVAVEGGEAETLVARACPLDPAAMADGQSRYSFFLNDDAGILDDVIVTRLSPGRFRIVVNACNAEADIAHLRTLGAGLDARIEPLDRVILALQGPQAEVALVAAGLDVADMAFMTAREPRPGWFLTRSGYTGEDGFEIALPEEDASGLAASLLADSRIAWVGLAARDSLRLEAGLCLHGQDITAAHDPVSAGLVWAVPKPLRQAGGFAGAEALARLIDAPPPRKRVGLKPEGRQPVRAGAPLVDAAGREIGTVTSGGFGPSAGHPVAMGYVVTAARTGALFAEVRGSRLPVAVHPLPFVPHRYRRG